MTETAQRAAAKEFKSYWTGRGDEKGESQKFWLSLLGDVFDVKHPEQFIEFEDRVMLDHTSFIDGYIPETKVLIEQKKLGKDLNAPIKQSDGTSLTPFQQAKRYSAELPYSKRPRWIVTCNFERFNVYDMENPSGEPEVIELKDLPKECYRLGFLTDSGKELYKKEVELSMAAGEVVGKLYDALLKQYKDQTDSKSLKSLNILCVRLVFCLYAEDAGIFGTHTMFHDYMAQFPAKHWRQALIELFKVLDTDINDRDEYMADDLGAFPYVNGGLFKEEDIEIPRFTEEIVDIILHKASEDFDWSEISPTIFGAVFESTLNPETRRSRGMHYTSIENIHKVIDPLFLDKLKAEFAEIKNIQVKKTRNAKLLAFQNTLATFRWMDTASGSGNFLTETYISIRRLENNVIKTLMEGQMTFTTNEYSPIRVSIDQFYGIEINDFAVTVAKTALWIAESQMMKETEDILLMHLNFLPLKTNAHIIEENALSVNWNDICPKVEINYIMGNPPFVGYDYMNANQHSDMKKFFGEKTGRLDYVTAWYIKTAQFIQGTDIRCAFVSTNSITQGVQVPALWKRMQEEYHVHIDFAYRTFIWDNEASSKARVHCVIIGFSSAPNPQKRLLIDKEVKKEVKNINFYLLEGPSVIVDQHSAPLCNVPKIVIGNMPKDGGGFIVEKEEYQEIKEKDPNSLKYLHRYMMGKEFINNIERYCFWFKGASPAELRECPYALKHINMVKEYRLSSTAGSTVKLADTPTLFAQIAQPDSDYVALPKVSSERRRYIPIGYLSKDVIAGDKLFIIPGSDKYLFGVLTSNVHMAWMRVTAGRLKSDYSYSSTVVYNTFPWPSPTDAQKAKIEETAQGILNVRSLYQESSLADLYDPLTMPPELLKAHQANDRAVMKAYGFNVGEMTEADCVAALMKMYQGLTDHPLIKTSNVAFS